MSQIASEVAWIDGVHEDIPITLYCDDKLQVT